MKEREKKREREFAKIFSSVKWESLWIAVTCRLHPFLRTYFVSDSQLRGPILWRKWKRKARASERRILDV
jgi:hypothetical protein